jgi:TatD DNase family protein
MTLSFVDSHCHLDDAAFDADRDAVIGRARAAGLQWLLTIGGSTPETLGSGLAFAGKHNWIYTTAGLHPHEAKRWGEPVADSLRALVRHPKVLAIGEIGLDYHYDPSPREVQKEAFLSQLDIAKEARLPVIIHCRDAWQDLREMIGTHWQGAGLGGILHCFAGNRGDAFRFLDWGFLISFAGNVSYKKADDLRNAAKAIPLDRLLAETDSPYLAPVPFRGRRNEPAYVVEVIRALASLHDLETASLGHQTLQNFERFFRLSDAGAP